MALGASSLALAAPRASLAEDPATVAPLNHTPWMNVFRRYDVDDEREFAFYSDVLGLQRLGTFANVGAGGVHRFKAGAGELKLTRRTPDRAYIEGGVSDATGLRLITFYFPDADALSARFTAAGLLAPKWKPIPGTKRSAALVTDPDGQTVELIAAPGEGEDVLKQVEVGLSVADLDKSRAFYKGFVGLDQLPPVKDSVLGTTLYPYRHGSTTVNLMSFGKKGLPHDTGSAGIQYVVADVEAVDRMAKARHVTVESPLGGVAGYQLRTIWLNDPDGITNYFAQVGAPPAPAAAGATPPSQ
jgi:catechol 2,3-dioxygenase-like lactoylglutathione lyase family enzyme